MFDTICTYPLTSDLFTQCIHPKYPLVALGLASGHVQLNRLPYADPVQATKAGRSTIETVWRTRRHKGSCRSLSFDHDGEHIFSAGTDGLVKYAAIQTGQVVSKIAVPLHHSTIDSPTLLHPLNPTTFLLATDSSALHLYDIRLPSETSNSSAVPGLDSINFRPSQTHHPHNDYVTSITSLPPSDTSTSGLSKQWISTGGTTVAVTDLRRGILVKSEDQGEELLSSVIVGDKLIIGGEKGGLRLWNVGVWDDNEDVVKIGKGASVDELAALPNATGVVVGLDDGIVRVVDLAGKRAKVVGDCRHDEVEGVGGLGFEVEGRMISGGGSVVKVWEERVGVDGEDGEVDEVDEGVEQKRINRSGNNGEDGTEEDDDISEDEKPKKRKKRKRRKDQGAGTKYTMSFKDMD